MSKTQRIEKLELIKDAILPPATNLNILGSKINEIIDFIQPKEEVKRYQCKKHDLKFDICPNCVPIEYQIDQYTVDKILEKLHRDGYAKDTPSYKTVESFKN